MAVLRVEDIKLSEHFNAALAQLGVVMPIDHHPSEAGEIVDAMGTKLLQVDPDGMLPDNEVQAIAALIIVAVNVMPDGQTVADHVRPRIASAYSENKMVPLLPYGGPSNG